MSSQLSIYTDGGARGNPGPAAIGVIFKDEKEETIKQYSEYLGRATNNETEYKAIIFALKKVKLLFGKKRVKEIEIKCHLDSELIVQQLNGQYKIKEKNLKPLFLEVWNLKIDLGQVSFKCIPREENKEADRLVNQELNVHEKKLSLPGV